MYKMYRYTVTKADLMSRFDLLSMGPTVVAIFGTVIYKLAAAIVTRLVVAVLLTAGITASCLVCFLHLVATGYSWFLIIPKIKT